MDFGKRADALSKRSKITSNNILIVDLASKLSDEDRKAISIAFKFSRIILWDASKEGAIKKFLKIKKTPLFPFSEKKVGDYIALAKYSRRRRRVKIFSNGGDIENFVQIIPVKRIVEYAKTGNPI